MAPMGLSQPDPGGRRGVGGGEVVRGDRETGVPLGLQTRGSNTPGMRKDVYCDERLLADPAY